MRTIATLFTGGGLADCGAHMAGFQSIGGVEYDAAIAEVARANGVPVTVGDVREVHPRILAAVPDLLHASPPCTNASVANAKAGETPLDRELALAVCGWLEFLKPPTFTLENVRGYRRFGSYQLIRDTLDRLGYWSNETICNFADLAVPQTRVRLILRASRDGFLPPIPPKQPWIGWYAAIEDLLDGLPESQFAPWQLARLPFDLRTALVGEDSKLTTVCAGTEAQTVVSSQRGANVRAFLVEGDANASRDPQCKAPGMPAFSICRHTGRRPSAAPRAFITCGMANDRGESMTTRVDDEPMFVVNAQTAQRQAARAFLVSGSDMRSMPTRDEGDPCFTVVAQNANPERPCGTRPRAWLSQGRIVKMIPRALARFQGVPDSYVLPDKDGLACKVIGNGVPSLGFQRIVEGLCQ